MSQGKKIIVHQQFLAVFRLFSGFQAALNFNCHIQNTWEDSDPYKSCQTSYLLERKIRGLVPLKARTHGTTFLEMLRAAVCRSRIEVYFCDVARNKLHRVATPKKSCYAQRCKKSFTVCLGFKFAFENMRCDPFEL